MNVELAEYLEDGSVRAILDGRETYIPADEGNWHWRMLQRWVEEGGEIASYVPFGQE